MRIILTGGGTGGHAYPVEAVYKEIKKNTIEDNQFLWIGSKKSIEQAIADKNNIQFKAILVGKLRRYFSFNNLVDLIKIPIGVIQSFFIIKKFQPEVIFSKGGFVSVPPVIAGKFLRIPIIVHESDIIPGLANRIAFKFADKILLGFEKTIKYFQDKSNVVYTGIPISQDVISGDRLAGLKYFKLMPDKKIILIIGGSQGAESINQSVIRYLDKFIEKFQIIHICGKNNFDKLEKHIKENDIGSHYHLYSYLYAEEMGNALATADLVISRAGASALNEIAFYKKPTILVPLSVKGSRGDQIENAKYFADNKAAVILNENELTGDTLFNIINEIFSDNDKQKLLAENIAKLSNISASIYIADIIDEYNLNKINLANIKKVHFVGIGGIGVSALARLFKKQNAKVTGSDIAESKITQELNKIGIKINIGEEGCSLIDAETDLLIYTVAAAKNNPDIVKAKKMNIGCLSYPQILSILTKDKYSICISGSHGKTTTTAIISVIMAQAQLDPTVIVGSNVKQFNGNARLGQSKYFVLEADEYKRAFLKYYPDIVILTSVEYEHPDIYKNLTDYLIAFKKYVGRIEKDGILIANQDDKNIMEISRAARCKKIFYSIDNQADIMAQNIRYKEGFPVFGVVYKNNVYQNIKLNIPGKFNIYNSLAAIALGLSLDIGIDSIKKSLLEYTGSWRRFEKKAEKNNITVIDDYAHHPTEVKATLEAARNKYPESRIICVYQPHQKKRTKELFNDFRNAFNDTNMTIITDIYEVAGREEDIDISSQKLVEMIKKDKVKYMGNITDIFNYLKENIKENDVIITMGAGTITNLSDQLADLINAK